MITLEIPLYFVIDEIVFEILKNFLNENNSIFISMINKDLLNQRYIFLQYDSRSFHFHFSLISISIIS